MYFGLEIGLKDLFSNVANTVEAKMNSLESTATRTVETINRQYKQLGLAVGAVAVGLTLSTFFGNAIQKAGEFSDKYADIQKTAGLTDQEVRSLADNLEQLDTRTNLGDMLDIAKVGGAVGVVKEEMQGFVESTNKAVVALGDEFKGGIEGVVKPLGTMKNLFAETKALDYGTAINNIGSAINQLGGEGLATGGNIAEFTARIGQLGNLSPNITQTMGLGAALEELGISAEIASGGVTNIMLMAGQNIEAYAKQLRMTKGEFTNLMNTNPNKMFLDLAKSMQGMSSSQIIATMKNLKIGTQESIKVMSLLANQTDLVTKRQESAAKAFAEGTSLQNEYALKNNTLAASMEKIGNKVEVLMKNIGERVAPVFAPLLDGLNWLLNSINEFIKTPFGAKVGQLVAVLGGLALVVGTAMVSFLTAQIALKGLGISFSDLIATGISPFASAYKFMTTSVMARTAAMEGFIVSSFAKMKVFTSGLGMQFATLRLQTALSLGIIQNRAMAAMASMRAFSISATLASIRTSIFNSVTQAMNGLRNLPQMLMGGARAMSVLGMNALRTAGSVMLTTVAIGTLLAPLLAIGAAVVFAYKSWNAFDELLEKTANGEYGAFAEGGMLGAMQKFGGVMRGVWEILKSVNSEGFSLPEDVYKALQTLGIADFVLALGTYAVRAYAFFEGFMDGFSALKGVFDPFWASLKQLGDTVFNALDSMGIGFGKATGEVSNFTAMGKAISTIILKPLQWGIQLITFFADGILYLEQNFGLLSGAVNVVVGLFQGLFDLITWIGDAMRDLPFVGEKINQLFPKEQKNNNMPMNLGLDNILGGSGNLVEIPKTGEVLSSGFGLPQAEMLPKQSMQQNLVSLQTPQNSQSVEYLRAAEAQANQRQTANQKAQQEALVLRNTPQNTNTITRETTKLEKVVLEIDGRSFAEIMTKYQEENSALGD